MSRSDKSAPLTEAATFHLRRVAALTALDAIRAWLKARAALRGGQHGSQAEALAGTGVMAACLEAVGDLALRDEVTEAAIGVGEALRRMRVALDAVLARSDYERMLDSHERRQADALLERLNRAEDPVTKDGGGT
jgi:hypothetical protein